jgi:hypothetical protein
MKTKNRFSYILGVSAFAGLVLMTNVARADEPVLTGKCTNYIMEMQFYKDGKARIKPGMRSIMANINSDNDNTFTDNGGVIGHEIEDGHKYDSVFELSKPLVTFDNKEIKKIILGRISNPTTTSSKHTEDWHYTFVYSDGTKSDPYETPCAVTMSN